MPFSNMHEFTNEAPPVDIDTTQDKGMLVLLTVVSHVPPRMA
jgi:hypothetical protein